MKREKTKNEKRTQRGKIFTLYLAARHTHSHTSRREKKKLNLSFDLHLAGKILEFIFSVTEHCFTLEIIFSTHWAIDRQSNIVYDVRVCLCINILRCMICVWMRHFFVVLLCFAFHIHFSFALCCLLTLNDANTAMAWSSSSSSSPPPSFCRARVRLQKFIAQMYYNLREMIAQLPFVHRPFVILPKKRNKLFQLHDDGFDACYFSCRILLCKAIYQFDSLCRVQWLKLVVKGKIKKMFVSNGNNLSHRFFKA